MEIRLLFYEYVFFKRRRFVKISLLYIKLRRARRGVTEKRNQLYSKYCTFLARPIKTSRRLGMRNIIRSKKQAQAIRKIHYQHEVFIALLFGQNSRLCRGTKWAVQKYCERVPQAITKNFAKYKAINLLLRPLRSIVWRIYAHQHPCPSAYQKYDLPPEHPRL